MKKLILVLLFIPVISFGQFSVEGLGLCFAIQNQRSFASMAETDRALDKILSVSGLSKNFIIQPCDKIKNALAIEYKGERYILYDKNFLESISSNTNSWSNLFILAHEVGHHVNGHTRDLLINSELNKASLADIRQDELEADKFAGFILASLGATLKEASQAINYIAPSGNDRFSSHPNREKRLEAVKSGFNQNKPLLKTNENIVKNDVYFFEDGSRWEGPVSRKMRVSQNNSVVSFRKPYGKGVLIFNDGTKYEGYYSDSLFEVYRNSKNSSVEYFNKGNEKAELNDHYGAIADYTKAIELDPNDFSTYYNRGIQKGKLNDHYGAIADYTKAIKLNPNFFNSYRNRGNEKNDLNDYYGAIADYTKAIELNPNVSGNYLNRAEVKRDLEDYQGAIADYTKVIELDPNVSVNYSSRSEVKQELEDYYGAIADYTKAIELDPNDFSIYYNRGIQKGKLNDHYGAIADYTKAIELDPNFSNSYLVRGINKWKIDDKNGACKDWRKAVSLGNKAALEYIYECN